MAKLSTSLVLAAAVAYFILFIAKWRANRQHVRKLQAANAVR